LKGVIPDIILPSTFDYLESEEGTEENAMKWDEIKTTEYDKLNRVQPYLPELARRSARRVAASRDFAYVTEDIALVKKVMADKSASLNELQRLKENADNENRKKIRDAELKGRKPQEAKIFDLTLKNGEVEMKEEKPADTNAVAETELKPDDSKTAPLVSTNTIDVVTTNRVAAANVNADADAEADADKPKPAAPAVLSPEERAPLEEAEHILLDYISLLRANSALTADSPKTP
jgi:carboxyl-terminal processing protease